VTGADTVTPAGMETTISEVPKEVARRFSDPDFLKESSNLPPNDVLRCKF